MPETKTRSNLDAALRYCELGIRVFSIWHTTDGDCGCGVVNCGSPGKHPTTQHGVNDATTQPDIVRGWWKKWPKANVGIATGLMSRLWVLDVDPRDGGNESLAELESKHGDLPETICADTGGGGQHFFFQHEGKIIKNSRGEVGAGLDIRGDGGYVVAPPSNHYTGGEYAWTGGIEIGQYELAKAPEWLTAMIWKKPEPAAHNGSAPIGEAAERCQKYLEKLPGAISGQGGHDRTLHAACLIFEFGLTESQAWDLLNWFNAHKCSPQWSEKELRHKLREGRKLVDAGGRFGSKLEEDRRTVTKAPHRAVPTPQPKPEAKSRPAGASQELGEWLGGIIDGSISCCGTPWKLLDEQTQLTVPGTITTICGDKGTGKTFITLDALETWHRLEIPCAAFFIEKNRRFHTHRLLAMFEQKRDFISLDWIKANPEDVQDALDRHADQIDALGRYIYSAPAERVTLRTLVTWAQQMGDEGKRALIIDPITAADAGADRWREDDNFMLDAQRVVENYGLSLILITHPKSGTKKGANVGAESGGKAYGNFSDTNLWLLRFEKAKKVDIDGGFSQQQVRYLMQIHKARFGPGSGREIAMSFGADLRFKEIGVVSRAPAVEDAQIIIPTF